MYDQWGKKEEDEVKIEERELWAAKERLHILALRLLE